VLSSAEPRSVLGMSSPEVGGSTRQKSQLHASICMGVPPRTALDLQAILQGLWSRSLAPMRKAIESAAAIPRWDNMVNVTLTELYNRRFVDFQRP
jgi:hypothetical protein